MSYILFLIVLLLGLTSTLASDGTNSQCVKKAGKQADNIKNWNINSSEGVKCYFKCLLINEKVMDKDGKNFNVSKIGSLVRNIE
jgi:PBP/GOBP family